jgi:hypothetical protein
MAFDWDLAIDRNREALMRIIAALFATLGLDPTRFTHFSVPTHV